MIKANELRIGNWVYENNVPIKLSEDDLEVFFAARNYEDLKPIALTSEILEKCGFVSLRGNGVRFDKELSNENKIMIDNYNTAFLGGYDTSTDGHGFRDVICEHLHQLQNLYFALTGEELNINL